MNKRLRKKHHRGEFACYGFDVEAELAVPNDVAVDTFWDAWIDFVESRHLHGGGVSTSCAARPVHTQFDVLVTAPTRYGSPTPADRDAVARWFAGQPAVVRFRLGPWIDVWHYRGERLAAHRAAPWIPGRAAGPPTAP